MTAKEIQKRNKKAEQLKVLQSDDGLLFVESAEGKILYNVVLGDEEDTCTCGDFARNIKKDPNFKCKHILSVLNAIPKKEIENAKFLEKHRPKLDERFLINIKGKDFILYAGVLDLSTQIGLLKLEVELLQFPSKENGNEAICQAVAEGKNGEVFSDIGDANPRNCAVLIVPHLIRMASTRAKARCLRDMCNVSIVAVEELGSFDDVIGSNAPRKLAQKKTVASKPSSKPKTENDKKGKAAKKDKPKETVKKQPKESAKVEPKESDKVSNQPKMSEAQKRAIYNLSRRRGVSVEELETMALDTYQCDLEELSPQDASSFIRNLQQAA